MTTSAFAQNPIAVFDSGLGGLTVLKELHRQLPQEDFIYLGDTARLPYGTKSLETIRNYADQNIRFLKELNVKAVVVACNSASSALLYKKPNSPIPIYNVIEPGARKAIEMSVSQRIGVIATRATVAGLAYVRSIKHFSENIEIYQQACPLLVPLVEEGWLDDPLTNLVIYRYLNPLLLSNIDTLILGCTHYPILKPALIKVTGPNIQLVDSAQSVAAWVKKDIQQGNLAANPQGQGKIRLLATDNADHFQAVAARILHPIVVHQLEHVHLNTYAGGSG